MQLEPRVRGQPGPHVRVVVRGVVVEDQMHLQALGNLTIDRAQELQKLHVPVTRQALSDHRAGQDIERGEQVVVPLRL